MEIYPRRRSRSLTLSNTSSTRPVSGASKIRIPRCAKSSQTYAFCNSIARRRLCVAFTAPWPLITRQHKQIQSMWTRAGSKGSPGSTTWTSLQRSLESQTVLTSLCLSISQRLLRKPLSSATLALHFTLPDMPLMVHSQVIRY